MGRRRVKVLTVIVVVLAGLFVAADRIAAHYADDFVAHKAQESYGYGANTDSYTHVSIGGFPFLTQALRRDFGELTITAGNLTADDSGRAVGGYLHVEKVRLNLRDVQVSATYDSAQAQSADGTVDISYADLSDALTRGYARGGRLTVSAVPGAAHSGPPSQAATVRLRGPYAGRQLTTDGTLRVAGDELEFQLPAAGGQGTDWSVGLPGGLAFQSVRATSAGVVVSVVGHQVVLGGATPLAR